MARPAAGVNAEVALSGKLRVMDDPHDNDASQASYTCPTCGETIVIPLDPSGPTPGGKQEYVEDCPVCCRPNVITVEWDHGHPIVNVRSES